MVKHFFDTVPPEFDRFCPAISLNNGRIGPNLDLTAELFPGNFLESFDLGRPSSDIVANRHAKADIGMLRGEPHAHVRSTCIHDRNSPRLHGPGPGKRCLHLEIIRIVIELLTRP